MPWKIVCHKCGETVSLHRGGMIAAHRDRWTRLCSTSMTNVKEIFNTKKGVTSEMGTWPALAERIDDRAPRERIPKLLRRDLFPERFQTDQGSEMPDTQKLTYKKDVLVAQLEERLTEKRTKRQAELDEMAERNQIVVDRLMNAAQNPQFVAWLVNRIRDYDPTKDSFLERVEQTWPETTPEEVEVDETLERLVRLYKNAEDKTVEIGIGDAVYRYL